MGKNRIVQANYLIDKKGRMSIDEMRVYYSMLRLIKKEDTDFKRMVIPIKDICEDWGIDENGYYTRLLDAAESLAGLVLRDKYVDENGRETEIIRPLISYAEYTKGSGRIVLEIHESMKPFLLELSRDFTQLYFDELKTLSPTGTRFYEIISKFEWIRVWTATVSQFKAAMCIEENKYRKMSDLERRVILPCVEEINERTHFEVTYKKNKKKNEEATLAFSIKSKNGDKTPKKKEATKHRYGDHQNVLLTDDELQKLKDRFPDWERRINDLSYYLGSKNVSYKSHYLTILNWDRREKSKKETNKDKPYRGPNGVMIDPTMPNILDEVMSEGDDK